MASLMKALGRIQFIIYRWLRPPSIDCPTGKLFPNEPLRTPPSNFHQPKKTDWDSYTREAEESFSLLEPPSSCSMGKLLFRKILNTSAKHYIPQGHIPNMIPNLTETAYRLIIERDTIRSSSPTHQQIPELNKQIRHNIADSNRRKWIQTVEPCSHKCNPSRLWSILKSLNGKCTVTPLNQPITFSSKTLTRNLKIATAFVKQFTSIVPYISDP